MVQEQIRHTLGVTRVDFEAKYLGLPTPGGRLKSERFQTVKDRLVKRVSSWSEKFLSSGEKDVLIKSGAQAIPTYIMSVFQLSNSLCDDLTRAIRKYWWGKEDSQRKTHWIAWEKFIKCKGHGGLGFCDFKLFNQALLARQAWRLIEFPESLCARLMKAKYFPNGNLLDTACPKQVSETWKAIMYGLDLLKKGTIWRVGSGTQIKI